MKVCDIDRDSDSHNTGCARDTVCRYRLYKEGGIDDSKATRPQSPAVTPQHFAGK